MASIADSSTRMTPLTVALSASLTISAFDSLLWYSSQFSPVMVMLTRATVDIEIVGAAGIDAARDAPHARPDCVVHKFTLTSHSAACPTGHASAEPSAPEPLPPAHAGAGASVGSSAGSAAVASRS